MTAFTATFWMGFKFLWRNPVNIAILVLFPIIIILILGNALAAYISPDTDLTPAPVAVASDPDGTLGMFLNEDEISRFLEITFTSRESAEQMAADETVIAAIIEDRGDISIVRPGVGGLHTQLVLSIIDSYKQIGSAATIAALSGKNVYAILDMEVNVRDVPLGTRIPEAMDYYAVTMLVMILLYTGMNGMDLFNKGLLSDMGNRNRVSPISKPALIGGLLAASTVTSFLQGMVTFIFTGAVYGVYWGERIPLVLLTLFAFVLFSQSLCIFLVMALRNQGAVSAIAQVFFWTSTFVSNGYMKIDFGAMEKVFQYAPNAMAHTIIFGAIFGGNEMKMMVFLFALFGVSSVLFVLAFLCGRRRLA